MKGRRLLITGAAGFTGRHAVAYFAAEGAEVTAVVRRCAAEASVFPAGVQQYICDLGDRKAVAGMIGEVMPDQVLHLAGKNSVPESWQDPLLYMETNVMATLYLLEALRFQPASRILVAGSALSTDRIPRQARHIPTVSARRWRNWCRWPGGRCSNSLF